MLTKKPRCPQGNQLWSRKGVRCQAELGAQPLGTSGNDVPALRITGKVWWPQHSGTCPPCSVGRSVHSPCCHSHTSLWPSTQPSNARWCPQPTEQGTSQTTHSSYSTGSIVGFLIPKLMSWKSHFALYWFPTLQNEPSMQQGVSPCCLPVFFSIVVILM